MIHNILAVAAISVALVSLSVTGVIVRRLLRAQERERFSAAQERTRLISQLMHATGKTWDEPPVQARVPGPLTVTPDREETFPDPEQLGDDD